MQIQYDYPAGGNAGTAANAVSAILSGSASVKATVGGTAATAIIASMTASAAN